MPVTLELSPEIERLLRQKAAQQGLALETYLGQLVERHAQALNCDLLASRTQILPSEFDRLVNELSEGLSWLPTLPAGWSRARLYEDHD